MANEFTDIAVGGGDALVDVDPYQLLSAMRDISDPRILASEVPALLTETTRIWFGSSDDSALSSDKRFADATWRDNPVYRRIGQTYLAWSAMIDRLADNPSLDWRRRGRARYAADILTAATAPTNVVVFNPQALKRVFETGGASLLRGARNMITDMVQNGGLPKTVDARGFTVGENLAATPGAVVYREEMFELLQYAPATETVYQRPLLMVPPQVNRHYFLDLAPGRSLVEYMVEQGISFFSIVWRNPRKEDGHWALDDYIAAKLRAIDIVREITGSADVNMFAACAGGLTTALTLGYLAAQHDDRVHSATLIVTMIDTSEPSLLQVLSNDRVRRSIEKDSVEAKVYEGQTLAANFAWMRPNDLIFNYVVNNWLLGNEPPAFDILAWNADASNLSAAFDRDMIDIYAGNKAATPGAVTILGTPIDLSKVECDNFIIAGRTDHITPWKPCYLTSRALGGPSDVVITSTGHIQTVVNPPGKARASYHAGPADNADPDRWLAETPRYDGSWWPRWADWLTSRSGERVPAGEQLGSERYPAGEPAPGRYVLE